MTTVFRKWRSIVLIAAISCAFLAGLGLATASRGSDRTTLGPSYGVSLDLPASWIGRIYDGNRGNVPELADLQAGSFSAASSPDLLKDESDIATTSAQAMAPDDVLILLWETAGSGGFDYQPLVGPPQVATTDLGTALEGFPSDHAVARRFFTTQGRAFDLMVEFGSASPTSAQIDRANQALRTLQIEPQA